MKRYSRIWELYRPYKGALLVAGVFLAMAAAVQGGLVFLIQHILDDVLIRRDAEALSAIPVQVFALFFIKGAALITSGWLVRRASYSVVRDLRLTTFSAQLAQEIGWHNSTHSAENVSRLTQEVEQVEGLGLAFAAIVEKPLTIVVLLCSALFMDWRLTLATFAVLPFVAGAISAFASRQRSTAVDRLDSLATLAVNAQEGLDGIEVVQSFVAEDARSAAFSEVNERQYRAKFAEAMTWIIPGPIVEVLAAVGVGLVISYGGHRVVAGLLAPGELMAFVVAVGLLNAPLKGLSQITAQLARAEAGGAAAFAVIDRSPVIADGGSVLVCDDATLEFRGVSIDYGDGPIIEKLSFSLKAGDSVAIVGPSGIGKSSILALVSRFVEPVQGAVEINGKAIGEYTLKSLREHVGVVGQLPFLFDCSIEENLRVGNSGATKAQIRDACVAAHAHEFIERLPEGYSTIVGARGGRLSVGERQRICIARAILADTPILLLDEATSALDRGSEEAVVLAIEALMSHRTTLMVTHKVDRIRNASAIVVVGSDGNIEVGTFAKLMESNSAFIELLGVAPRSSA
jgi:ATP-binding cassette, subfamily B, bacterial MsbA